MKREFANIFFLGIIFLRRKAQRKGYIIDEVFFNFKIKKELAPVNNLPG